MLKPCKTPPPCNLAPNLCMQGVGKSQGSRREHLDLFHPPTSHAVCHPRAQLRNTPCVLIQNEGIVPPIQYLYKECSAIIILIAKSLRKKEKKKSVKPADLPPIVSSRCKYVQKKCSMKSERDHMVDGKIKPPFPREKK
jgi:hypothetical protein